jgi:hypothetical protein
MTMYARGRSDVRSNRPQGGEITETGAHEQRRPAYGRFFDRPARRWQDAASMKKHVVVLATSRSTQVPNTRVKVAFLSDPWGTYIELTEGLAP